MGPLSPLLRAFSAALRDQNRRMIDRAIGPATARVLTCGDCRERIWEGAKSAPSIQKVFSDPCYRWRAARMCEFDPRSRQEIAAAEGRGAA